MEARKYGRSDDVPFLATEVSPSELESGSALSQGDKAQPRRVGWWLLLVAICIVGIVALVNCFAFQSSGEEATVTVSSASGVNNFEFKSGAFRLLRTENGVSEAILSGTFGAGLIGGARLVAADSAESNSQTWVWDEAGVQLRVEPSEQHSACLSVQWQRITESPKSYGDCFDLAPDQQATYWYGGAERYVQYWPINEEKFNTTVFQPFDNFAERLMPGSVLESRWINSRGGSIQVDPKILISTSMNDPVVGATCIFSSNQSVDLSYHFCGHDNVKEAQSFLLSEFTAHPTSGRPADSMFQDPIWSTWAVFHADISQSKVLDFANQVISNGFKGSNLEIDDKWQVEYGDLEFDPVKFPAPAAMIDTLHAQGFDVTLWVMPFANPESAAFAEGASRGYWVKNATGDPALVKWWQGVGAVLDVTNDAAVDWFVARLNLLRTRYSIDSFKFDAGETMYLPEDGVYAGGLVKPADYTTAWVRVAARFAPLAEVRSGWQTQDAPIFTREMDRDSRWGLDNGLASVLTSAFQFGVAGYPFVLPDMIGGNGYNGSFVNIQFPTKELFIRWMEANALLPSLQLSFAPFHYDNETIAIGHSMIELHNRFAPLIIELAEQARTTSFPIVRPMYWLAPTDSTTHAIASQFALGDDVIVAPILEDGAVSRDIYLPAGVWVDDVKGTVLEGPVWLMNYGAALHELPRFVRQASSAAKL